MLDYYLILNYTSLRTAIIVGGQTLRDQPEICNAGESDLSVSAIMYADASDSYAIDFYEIHYGLPDLPGTLGQSAYSILKKLSVAGKCIGLPSDSTFVGP